MSETSIGWVQVRIRSSTHRRLIEVRDRLFRVKEGDGRSPYVACLNDAIEVLLDRFEQHRERSRKAYDRRAGRDVLRLNAADLAPDAPAG